MEDGEVTVEHERGVDSGCAQVLDSVLIEGLVRQLCSEMGIRIIACRVLGGDIEWVR